MRYYAQWGEDQFCHKLLGDIYGTYIDIGALDGKHLSNTYFFEQNWRGVCIEPNSFFYYLLKKNRPNSICLKNAIADYDRDDIDFAENYFGTLSTLKPELYESTFRKYYKDRLKKYNIVKINVRKLDTIIKENNIDKIDILSIDVEGEELNVLLGLDINLYKPRIIIVECPSEEPKKEIIMRQFMDTNHYYIAIKTGINLICLRDNEDYKKSKKIEIDDKLIIHTGNPRD